MNYVYNILLPDIIKQNNNFHSIYIDKVEADDIIATTTNYIKNMYKCTIYIVTNDNDLKQLGDNNIYFINLIDKKFFNINKTDMEILLNNKILYIDKS